MMRLVHLGGIPLLKLCKSNTISFSKKRQLDLRSLSSFRWEIPALMLLDRSMVLLQAIGWCLGGTPPITCHIVSGENRWNIQWPIRRQSVTTHISCGDTSNQTGILPYAEIHICMAESAAESRSCRREARALTQLWMLPYIHIRSSIASEATRRGVQLSVVRKKLNVVADGGPRKLSVVTGCSWAWSRKSWTWSPMWVAESWAWSPMERRKKVGGTTLLAI